MELRGPLWRPHMAQEGRAILTESLGVPGFVPCSLCLVTCSDAVIRHLLSLMCHLWVKSDSSRVMGGLCCLD